MDSISHKDNSSENYRDLFDNIIDSVCILDSEGNLLDVNESMTELTGYQRGELIGMNVKHFVHRDDLEKSKEYFNKLKEEGSYGGFNGKLTNKNGDLKYIEVSSKAFYDNSGKVIGSRDIIRDVTQRRKIEADLINSEQRFRTVVTNSEAIIFILDSDGLFTLSEGKGLASLGLKPGEVVGSSVFELYKDYPDILDAVTLAMEGTSSKLIVTVGDLHFDTYYSPYLCPEGRCQGVIGLSVDITERILKEKELEEARRRAEESDHLKTAFLANMSHEIRTPMNAILGFSSLLADDQLGPSDKKSYLEIIRTKGEELLQMLTDLIDISKIEAGIISVSRNHFSLNDLITEYIMIAEHELVIRNNHNVKIEFNIPDQETIIDNDENKVRQILNNLVQNAVKFTKEGTIEIGFTGEPGRVIIYVKDTGVGIRKEKQSIIFERFRQVDDDSNKSSGGTGLGLYICQTLIKHMGGDIWVDSEPGEGSTFSFSLPL